MKKKIIIIVSIIIVLVLIILGIIDNFEPFHFTGKMFFGKKSRVKLYDEEYEEIDTIYIDVDNAIINIKNGDDNAIKVKVLSNRKNIKLKSYNKKLSLKVDYYEGCFFCKMNVIEITAPKNFKDYLTISNKHGHVNIESFPNATMSITNKIGNVSVTEAKVVKVVSRRGSINIGKASNASIYSFWGILTIGEVDNLFSNSTLLEMNVDYVKKYINIKNDFGDINIKKADILRDSIVEVGFGDINIKKLKEDTGKLKKKN